MRIVVCTSSSTRHRWVANLLAAHAQESLVITECRPSDEGLSGTSTLDRQRKERFAAEVEIFTDSNSFRAPTLALEPGEINLPSVAQTVQAFRPDAVFVFGASIIKEPLISNMPRNRTINMHLGLSPYYRGTATNFWPFVNDELQFVGATILHLDPGVDTGDIICHVRPPLRADDSVHTAGCRVIQEGAQALVRIMEILRRGKSLQRTPQWKSKPSRYYRIRDLNEEAVEKCEQNLRSGMIGRFLASQPEAVHLTKLDTD